MVVMTDSVIINACGNLCVQYIPQIESEASPVVGHTIRESAACTLEPYKWNVHGNVKALHTPQPNHIVKVDILPINNELVNACQSLQQAQVTYSTNAQNSTSCRPLPNHQRRTVPTAVGCTAVKLQGTYDKQHFHASPIMALLIMCLDHLDCVPVRHKVCRG